jgi:membrane protease subunit (stomatin/prohibitin family)
MDMSEFMEVIEWFDETGRAIVHRYPPSGSAEIKLGAQLVVRTSQAAIFFRDGKGLDVFGAGRHTLTTNNLPILTKLLSLPWGFTSPFRVEIVFVNLMTFTNLRWGTKDPVAFKDSQLGLVRLRAFGAFSMRVTQPLVFVNSLAGTQGEVATEHVEDYLREVIVSRLNDYLGESIETLADLPKHYDEMGAAVRTRLADDFGKYGMALVDFFVNRITPPEDVQKMIDERSGMAAVGDLERFLKFKAAKALGDAAVSGGVGGPAMTGLGLGAGAGIGLMLPGMLLKTLGAETPTQDPIAAGDVVQRCARCGEAFSTSARFCPSCGQAVGSQFRCQNCQAMLSPGTRFCVNCGERVSGSGSA